MAQGGDWSDFRKEISRLVHEEASSQEEFVTLLEAHRNLLAVAEHCFPPDQCAELRRIGQAEYLSFLNVEATEGEHINPTLLDRITAREVADGRMAADDDFRQFASDSGTTLGDTADLQYDRKLGDKIGIWSFALGAAAFFLLSKTLGLVLFVTGMGIGWWINERRKKAVLLDARISRAAKGYD